MSDHDWYEVSTKEEDILCGEAEESGEDYFIPRVNYDRRIGENSGLGNSENGGDSRGSRGSEVVAEVVEAEVVEADVKLGKVS